MTEIFLRAVALIWPFLRELLNGDADDPVYLAGRRLIKIVIFTSAVNIGAFLYVTDIAINAHQLTVEVSTALETGKTTIDKLVKERDALKLQLSASKAVVPPDCPPVPPGEAGVVVHKIRRAPPPPPEKPHVIHEDIGEIIEEIYKEDK